MHQPFKSHRIASVCSFVIFALVAFPSYSREIGITNFDSSALLPNLRSSGPVDLRNAVPLLKDAATRRRALDEVALELVRADSDTRNRIVGLLEDVGLTSDQKPFRPVNVIHDNQIIRILLENGFAKQDLASTRAKDLLLDRCTPEELARHRRVIMERMRALDKRFVLIAAKAKIFEARPYIEKLAQTPHINQFDAEDISIARAALGDKAVEQNWLAQLKRAAHEAPTAPPNNYYDVGNAKDGEEVEKLLWTIRRIGTTTSLRAICSFLRSDLKTYVVDRSEESIRYKAVAALSYTFPDEKALATPYEDEHWRNVERFCSVKIGATFDGPTPPAPKDFGYPHF